MIAGQSYAAPCDAIPQGAFRERTGCGERRSAKAKKNINGMASTQVFLPALNALLHSLPKQAGFLSVGLPGSAFEQMVLALRPDLTHVSALSTDLLTAFPEFARALVGRGCPRMVLGPQSGDAVIGPVIRLGGGVLRARATQVRVRAFAEVASGLRNLALLHVDGATAQPRFLAAAIATLARSDTLLWLDRPAEAGEEDLAWLAQLPGIEAYAVYALSDCGPDCGHVRPAQDGLETAGALILVPDRHWHHEQFAAPGTGEAHCGRLLPKARGFAASVSARLAGLPVEDRMPDLPLRRALRFGDGVFADWGAVPTDPARSEISAQLRGGQVLCLLLPSPPVEGAFVSLTASSEVAPLEAFTAVLRTRTGVLPMPLDAAHGRFATRVPARLARREPFVRIEVTPADSSGSHIMSLTLAGVEVSTIYCDAGMETTQLEPL